VINGRVGKTKPILSTDSIRATDGTVTVKVLGDDPELDDQIARQVPGSISPGFSFQSARHRRHPCPGVKAADKKRRSGRRIG
jgi:hypothetical protein